MLLEIDNEQLAKLAPLGERAVERRIKEHLLHFQPATVKDAAEPELLRRIRGGVSLARSYSLTGEYNLTMFVSLMFAVSPRFDLDPEAHAVLTDSNIEPNSRLEQMLVRVSPACWMRAGQAAVVSLWP